MSTYSIPDLWSLWVKGELGAEQAVGYLLQNLLPWVQWRAEVERWLRHLEETSGKPPA